MSSPQRSAMRLAGPATATHGSQTILQTESGGPSTPRTTIRLRAEPAESRHIHWAEDVIDNEGMGKKSSKVCCIYHKPRGPDDSASSDESSDSSDSDSEPDLSRAQRTTGRGRNAKGKGKQQRKPSPNAYERQPKAKGRIEG